MKRFLPLILVLPTACAAPQTRAPSLAPRAAETIDPRLPVPDRSGEIPADAELQARAQALVADAAAADGRFGAAIAIAERLAARAGSPQSESWIAAQQALSAAIAERYPLTRALGDIDALTQQQVQNRGGLPPADLATIADAAGRIAELDRAQAARVSAVQARLRG